jgi:hypothetical protein
MDGDCQPPNYGTLYANRLVGLDPVHGILYSNTHFPLPAAPTSYDQFSAVVPGPNY